MKKKSSEHKLVSCGKVGRAVGLKGEFRIQVSTDDLNLNNGDPVFIGTETNNKKYTIAALRKQGRFSIISLDEIQSREDAFAITGKELFVYDDLLPDLSEDEYYHHQILGLRVVTVEGQELGEVFNILRTGANDVYEIKKIGEKKEILIPAIKDVIVSIDIEKKLMTIRPLEGMIDEEE